MTKSMSFLLLLRKKHAFFFWIVVGLAALLVLLVSGRNGMTAIISLSSFDKTTTTTSSSSPSQRRISYQLHSQNVTGTSAGVFTNKYGSRYSCHRKVKLRQRSLEPAAFYQAAGVLDFATTIDTNLRLIVMGDSVGLQFSHALEEAAGVAYDRQVLRETARVPRGSAVDIYEGLHSAPTPSGGWIAGWRLTGLLSRAGENQPLPNQSGGGWTREDVSKLAQHMQSYYQSNTQPSQSADTTTMKPALFDTMIFRIPQGWISADAVTFDSLQETTELAYELFGVQSLILVSLPPCTNYISAQDIRDMQAANQRLLEFAHEWNNQQQHHAAAAAVQHVVVLDFGQFGSQLVLQNAALLGGFSSRLEQVYTHRLKAFKRHEFFAAAEAHVCSHRMMSTSTTTSSSVATTSSKVVVDDGDCVRNYLSFDGMHWCMETIGGRVLAGTACLLACLHNTTPKQQKLSKCQRRCNDQFMSLKPITDYNRPMG